MFGGKAVADHENVGNQAIGDAGVINLSGAGALGDRVTHVRIPRHRGINLFLGEEIGWLDAVLGMDSVLEDLLALLRAQTGGLEPVPQEEVRRRVRSEGHGLAGEVFNAVDALLADHAVSDAGPINNEKRVRAEDLILEQSVVFDVHVQRGQHHVNVVGGQGGGAFGPVVDDFEGNFQALLGEDGVGGRLQAAVGDQPAHATDPDVDADANFRVLIRCGGDRNCQRLGGIKLVAARSALAPAELAQINDAIPVQAVTDQRQPDQEDQEPSAFFNLHRHGFSPYYVSAPPGSSLYFCRFAPNPLRAF